MKSDIIVCLGGGGGDRIKKAVELYDKNYSTAKVLVLTGDNRSKKRKKLDMDDKRIEYIKNSAHESINFVHYSVVGNTKVEILFIKNYMIDNNFKTAMIISDVPHTRRIRALLNLIDVDGDDNLLFNIVGSDTAWWNSDNYYKTKRAQVFSAHETIKLIYTYVAFGFLEKVGLFEATKEVMKPSYDSIKKQISKTSYFYLKEKK